ncbi:glutathione S-transferase family protein [Jannaschia sp. 2305UL9-9]|uniref:glutathione S-transferase family protein n=1 Tax=Jannaschia sp. 2305UL9-9 TaxID=3121638 RepID=UPI0035286415
MLIEGKWSGAWHPVQAKDGEGRFLRQTSAFRNWITPDGRPGPTGEGGFAAEAGRYRLFVALICPWASRTLIARALKRLEGLIDVTVLEPFLADEGWGFGDFPGAERDPLHGADRIHEYYTRADARYTGRATVPVLWDTQRDTMVSNESADILRMFDGAFDGIAPETPKLYPADIAPEIEALEAELYPAFNNGVYRAGFASSQAAYDEAVADVFATLERLERMLSDGRPYLLGDGVTGADVRAFVTLVRFDLAYHGLFKCDRARIADYPGLSAYADRIAELPGVAATVSAEHIRHGYYSIRALNPSGIVPVGPDRSPGVPS